MSVGKMGKMFCDACGKEITGWYRTITHGHVEEPGKTTIDMCADTDDCMAYLLDDIINDWVQKERDLIVDELRERYPAAARFIE